MCLAETMGMHLASDSSNDGIGNIVFYKTSQRRYSRERQSSYSASQKRCHRKK